MHNNTLPITLIPEKFHSKIIKRKFKKHELIFQQGDKNFFYILSGSAIFVKFDENGEKIYPHLMEKEDFIGIHSHISDSVEWETISHSDNTECLEIPAELFKKYILNTNIFSEKILPRSNEVLFNGIRGFYIYSQGGVFPYFAFILNMIDDKLGKIEFKRYSDFTRVIYSNRSNLYKITSKMIEDGVIIKNKRNIEIVDKKKLIKYFSCYYY